jgi:hypothetical protein
MVATGVLETEPAAARILGVSLADSDRDVVSLLI